MKPITKRRIARPRTTHYSAAQQIIANNHVDTKTGHVYNQEGERIGGSTYEPRITVHLGRTRKYNARISKVVALTIFGPEAFRRGVSVRHIDENKFNNAGSNLYLVYNRTALRNYNRLQTA